MPGGAHGPGGPSGPRRPGGGGEPAGAGRPPIIAVLGLGEAGGAIARDLAAAGAVVRAYDPAVPTSGESGGAGRIIGACGEADAATGADLVLSVNSAHNAMDALTAGARGVADGVVWADLNTGSPGLKRRLDEAARERGVRFTDIAIMAPVPGRGLRTPMLSSGGGAADTAALLGALGASVEVLDGPPGLAASRKLLRSVFYKGMSAAVVEALEAARAAGCEEWLRDNIAAEFAMADEATVDRIVSGTRRHSVRRAAEMSAATEMLLELGLSPHMTPASRDLLRGFTGR